MDCPPLQFHTQTRCNSFRVVSGSHKIAKANDAGGEEMRKYTLMVYMAADETLANFAIESLKQLRDAATDDVLVAAQFDPDGLSNAHPTHRYIFDGTNKGQPFRDKKEFWEGSRPPLNMTTAEALVDFMNWVYKHYEATNYCLVLWGHGPELLIEAPVRGSRKEGNAVANQTKGDNLNKVYFTPAELKEALNATNPEQKKKLQIIGMDTCSTGMCEFAYELKDQAKFMLASEEEVPDLGLPYPTFVAHLANCSTPEEVCRKSVEDYVKAYQQYVYSASTGMHPVTLAAIRLTAMDTIKQPLYDLCQALRFAPTEAEGAIFNARLHAKNYVGGLFCDVEDFCNKLRLQEIPQNLKEVCGRVSKAIEDVVATRAGIVNGHIAGPNDPNFHSHGLSFYFPYLTDGADKQYLQEDLVKGTPRILDRDSEMVAGYQQLNMVVRRIRDIVRREMIKDIESHYVHDRDFSFASDTKWYQFIQLSWSRILAERKPDDLDTRYVAEQCVKNLLHLIHSGNDRNGIGVVKSLTPIPRQDDPSTDIAPAGSNGGVHPPSK
jgi:Clostripain family